MQVRYNTHSGVMSFDKCSRCQKTRVAKFTIKASDKRKKPITRKLCDRCARHLDTIGTDADYQILRGR